ncbi:MAG: hypothetical protein U0P30_06485 [Vicinamibacterales bacterium]
MTARRVLAYAWASPTTLLGLFAGAACGARWQRREGVLEGAGPGVARGFDLMAPGRGIVAMTLGHVVLGRDAAALDETRAHERVHVTQCERWGAAFVPAYLAASAIAWARGGDAYRDNPFERAAWTEAPLPRCRAASRTPLDDPA